MRRAFVPVTLGVVAIGVVAIGVALTAAPAFAGSSQYPPRAATCAAAPSAGSGGTPIVVKGTNWAPRSSVAAAFVQSGSSSALGTATVDAGGKFSLNATTPPGAQRGKAQIAVTGTSFTGARVSCATNFEVVDPHRTAAVLPRPRTPVNGAEVLGALGLLIGATAFRIRRRRAFPAWTRVRQ